LIEVVLATAIAALVMAGMFTGYNMAGRRAQFSACNIAANNCAMAKMEQCIAAQWVPSFGITELFAPSLTVPQPTNLCLPVARSNFVTCTNYTTISQVSSTPPYALIQVQCVWSFPAYGGTYTNTVTTLRAAN
jgi:hypothetical protein